MSDSEHYQALASITEIFNAAGFYAYRTLDDQNRWSVAVDIEEGHIDVRIGPDGFDLDVWATSPGLFVDEEDPRRQRALERLARISIPGIRRGFLEENQTLEWSDLDQGLSLRSSFGVAFSGAAQLPRLAIEQLGELNQHLRFIERRIG